MTYSPSHDPPDLMNQKSPHLLWIRFLSDTFKVAQFKGQKHIHFFIKLLEIALNPERSMRYFFSLSLFFFPDFT